MIDPNENRTGYKKTYVGWIPPDWSAPRFENLWSRAPQNGLYKGSDFYGSGSRMIHMPEIFAYNRISDQKMKRVALSEKERTTYALADGDLIFGRRSLAVEGAGKCSIIEEPCSDLTFESSIIRVTPNREVLDSVYAYYYIESSAGRYQMFTLTRVVAVAGIAGSDLKLYRFPLPPLTEQKKIAAILSIWDKAIEQTAALIEAKRQQKKALMQQLLSGHRRLPGFEGEWKQERLHDLCSIQKGCQRNRAELDREGLYPVINGGQTPSGYTEEWNTEANTITVSEGGNSCGFVQLIHSRFWCGGHCYSLSRLKCEKEFLFHLLKFQEPKIMLLRVGSGLPNIQKGDLSALSLTIPEANEQRAIAAVLDAADKEITSLVSKLEALRQQKKGLMQRLLTGQVRVKV